MRLLDLILRRRPAQNEPRVEERRRFPRYAIKQPVEVFIAGRSMHGNLRDLSLGGASLFTRYSRDPGEVVGVLLTVEDVARALPLRVLWTRLENGLFVMGGAFVDLTEQELDHLQSYLDVYAEGHGALTQRLHIA